MCQKTKPHRIVYSISFTKAWHTCSMFVILCISSSISSLVVWTSCWNPAIAAQMAPAATMLGVYRTNLKSEIELKNTHETYTNTTSLKRTRFKLNKSFPVLVVWTRNTSAFLPKKFKYWTPFTVDGFLAVPEPIKCLLSCIRPRKTFLNSFIVYNKAN